MTTTITKGQRFYTPQFDGTLEVRRVSKSGEWADIKYFPASSGGCWTKRQPLIDGGFAFAVVEL